MGKAIFLLFFLSWLTVFFPQSAYCWPNGGFFSRWPARQNSFRTQACHSSYKSDQPAKQPVARQNNQSSLSASAAKQPSPAAGELKSREPVTHVGRERSRGLTSDELKAKEGRQRRYAAYGLAVEQKQSLDPEKAARAASAATKDLGEEGRQAYALTMKKDVAHYKEKQWVAAIDAFDPKTGAVVKLRRGRENGHYVFNVYDQATGLWLHNLKSEDKNIIALSPSGLKIKVGYGDSDSPQWASIGYYPTNLNELNIFAGYNRGDDHLIRAIRPVAASPSDRGQWPEQPITYTLEELRASATRRDPYSGLLVRPELAALTEAGALSDADKLKIAQAILEDTPQYGRFSSISERITTISKSDEKGALQREYAVYGARNYRGQIVYFGVEIASSPIELKQNLLSEKALLSPLPAWVQAHIDQKTFAWFPGTWEGVQEFYQRSNLRVEKLRSYLDETGKRIFHEVRIIQPGIDPSKIIGGRGDIMLFRLDLDQDKLNK